MSLSYNDLEYVKLDISNFLCITHLIPYGDFSFFPFSSFLTYFDLFARNARSKKCDHRSVLGRLFLSLLQCHLLNHTDSVTKRLISLHVVMSGRKKKISNSLHLERDFSQDMQGL